MTLARNIDVSQSQLVRVIDQLPDGTIIPPIFGQYVVVKRLLDKRPASVTTPMIRGWRAPQAFYHHGITAALSPSSTRGEFRSGGKVLWYRLWEDSCFWYSHARSDPPPPPSWVKAEAELKALMKLKSQSVNLGVVLGEARQTAKLVASTIDRIRKGVEVYQTVRARSWAVVKSRQLLPDPSRRWKDLPQDWLELQYGWKPLLADIKGACEALEDRFALLDPIIRVRAKAQHTEHEKIVVPARVGASRQEYDRKTVYKGYCNLYYTVDNPILRQLQELGLTNPAIIAWELLRYSFVVDWVIPIGNWLSVLDADLGLRFKGGCYGDKRESSEEFVGQYVVSDSGYEITSPGTTRYIESRQRFDRSVYYNTPVPGIYFKNPLSGLHLANAMSLLVQTFNR